MPIAAGNLLPRLRVGRVGARFRASGSGGANAAIRNVRRVQRGGANAAIRNVRRVQRGGANAAIRNVRRVKRGGGRSPAKTLHAERPSPDPSRRAGGEPNGTPTRHESCIAHLGITSIRAVRARSLRIGPQPSASPAFSPRTERSEDPGAIFRPPCRARTAGLGPGSQAGATNGGLARNAIGMNRRAVGSQLPASQPVRRPGLRRNTVGLRANAGAAAGSLRSRRPARRRGACPGGARSASGRPRPIRARHGRALRRAPPARPGRSWRAPAARGA